MKKIIQIAGNPTYTKPKNKNSFITNPNTGTPIFGNFPEIEKHGFAAGPIYLKYGDHKGKNNGFGLFHIWTEHFKNFQTPEEAEASIVGFINSIIPNGEILYESGKRNLVFKRGSGVVILEPKLDGTNQTYYSIVTAFQNNKPHGYKIGQIKF